MQLCIHPELNFASGDYYVTCARCNAMWMRIAKDGLAEYSSDSFGQPIGADHSQANSNVTAMTAGPRFLHGHQQKDQG